MRSKRKKKKKNRLQKAIAVILLISALLFTSLQLYVMLYPLSDIFDSVEQLGKIERPQAVLVLGAAVYASGNPSPVLKDRLDYAYQVYEYYDGKIAVIVSGDNGTVEYNETKAMYDYLISKGVNADDIYRDYAGFNTYDSIYRAGYIFKVQSIIICTQRFHIYRALYIAKRLGFKAYGYAAENKSIYNMTYNHIRESLARIKAVMETDIMKRQPKYLGDPIPVKQYE
ncbi:MAG TPA: ElyC/SanA/YdcF family protein [Clostridia bacterium]|jgi:SanA protein|nr:ElyC/SanA/YdcF family protein [Clostridia bacterium]HPY98338.1 ElyC/SanA/YdcF family protein [Clostridia bacterium]HQC68272.1 ElyC/SanA/YdcF family protein [Clostridia bacterium]